MQTLRLGAFLPFPRAFAVFGGGKDLGLAFRSSTKSNKTARLPTLASTVDCREAIYTYCFCYFARHALFANG